MQFREPPSKGRRLLLVAAPAVLLGACSSDTPEPAGSGAPLVDRADIADVIYRTGATDEGLLTLLNARPVSEPSAEPVVTAPAEAANLTPLTSFEYRAGTTALRRVRRARAWSLDDFFALERTAFAHGAPMNGDAFLLAFSTSRAPKLLRVFTQDKSYAPTDDEWQRLAAAGEIITLTLTRGVFEQGRLIADGGPFVGKPLHFSASA
ncbi:MAG TPA: hypothetical protein VLJ38_00915 [Polyangiaceae bacterium]|nr:hypothetical protein [Polyangiaceae bacterium]